MRPDQDGIVISQATAFAVWFFGCMFLLRPSLPAASRQGHDRVLATAGLVV